MQNIEQKAIQTYQQNLEYFEKNHKTLFDKITLLSTLIEEGKYNEKYELEYKDEGYFDAKEISSQEYLYKMNSKVHANILKEMIDKKRQGAIFKGMKLVRATDAQADLIDKSELSFHNYLWASIKIINYTDKYATPESYMRRVYKVIFVGTGLGVHINDIVKKLQSEVVFIQEKNLELFRLSLFVTDYANISINRTLYFSILENETREQEIFLEFLNKGNNYNLNIKHIPFDNSYKTNLQQFQKYVLSQDFINYGYSPILLRFVTSPRYLVQNYNFLNVSVRQKSNIFSQKPVLLLFSGPSTSHNIEWVKKNHQKFIIISPLSTCKLLSSFGIKPDIAVHIDPGEKTALLFEGLDAKEYFKDIQVILAANVNENTIKRFDKSQVHVIEQGSKYKKDFGVLTAPSVGEYSYALSLIFNAADVYMLGIDLALDKKTLKSHADYHFGQMEGRKDDDSATLDPETSISYVKGNLGESIPTTAGYEISIEQLNFFTKYYKSKTQTIYNLSDGAYFEDVKPVLVDKYNWQQLPDIDKTTLSSSIYSFFNEIGSNKFRAEDKETLLYQLNEAKKLKKKIIKHQKTKYTNISKYLQAISQLSWELSDMDYKTNSDLAQVYYQYFQTILSYIFDLFNTQDLDNTLQHLIQIDKFLVAQLLKIANYYINNMQNYCR